MKKLFIILWKWKAVYFGTGTFKLPEDAFVAVYGVNHAKTGKCTYSNIVVYGSEYDNGVVNVNNKEFENSALKYLEDADADYLYAWRFGYYDGRSKNYTKIPTGDQNEASVKSRRHTLWIDPEEDIYLGFRAYLEPATKVGPSWNELVLDRAIVFLRRK